MSTPNLFELSVTTPNTENPCEMNYSFCEDHDGAQQLGPKIQSQSGGIWRSRHEPSDDSPVGRVPGRQRRLVRQHEEYVFRPQLVRISF